MLLKISFHKMKEIMVYRLTKLGFHFKVPKSNHRLGKSDEESMTQMVL